MHTRSVLYQCYLLSTQVFPLQILSKCVKILSFSSIFKRILDTGIWSRVSSVNQGPSARFSVAGDCLDSKKGILVFMGGCNKYLEALDDMYYLYTALPELNVLPEDRHEKFSLKKELKRKCQEEYFQSNRFDKRNPTSHHGILETSQALYLPSYSQEGTRYTLKEGTTFQARITNSGDYGFSIETVIEGKLLHGMILSSTASITVGDDSYPNKNRTGSAGIVSVNEYQPTLQTIGENQQKTKNSDQGQGGNVEGGDPTTHEPCMGTLGLNLTNSAPDTSVDQPNKSSSAAEPLGLSSEHPKYNEALNISDNQNAGNSCENLPSNVQELVPSLPTQAIGIDEEQDKQQDQVKQ